MPNVISIFLIVIFSFLPGIDIIKARDEVEKLYFVYRGAIGIKPESAKEHMEFILREEQGLGASGSMRELGNR